MQNKTNMPDGEDLYTAQTAIIPSGLFLDLNKIGEGNDYQFVVAGDSFSVEVVNGEGDVLGTYEITEESFHAHDEGATQLEIVGAAPIEM